MIGKIIGAIIGNRLDRRDGRGGVHGAVLGSMAPGLIRRTGKLGMIVGGAYLAKKVYDSTRNRRTPDQG